MAQRTMSISGKQMSFREIFLEIQKQTGYTVVYNNQRLDADRKINVDFRKVEVGQILEKVLQGTGLRYEFEDDFIILSLQDILPQQGIRISGIVRDTKKNPLPGVTIRLAGTTLGTATDAEGAFVLNLAESKGTLELSFVGYKSKKVNFSPATRTLQIVMEEEVTEMEEVVVTGMFTRKANSFTGAAQTFNKEEIRRVGNMNVLQSIKNLDPSFRIAESMENGSNPNQKYDITLRGQSGFPDLKGEYSSNPNNPLFIVDGFEQSVTYVMDMDMNRVASVTLLKDAAAKAIYGSKAANGVVVIETVLPEKGKLRVTYTGSMNVQLPDLSSYDLCNAREKLEVEYNAGKYTYFMDNGVNISINPASQYSFDQVYNKYLKEVVAGVDTDWKSIPLRNGIGQKHTVYLEGGDDYFRYGLDVSYNNVAGVMKGSNRNTFMGGVTLSYRYKNLM